MPGAEVIAPGDLALARAASAGERPAMEQILDRMSCVPRILSAQNEQLGRPLGASDLDDVGQDVMLLVWQKLPTFEGRATLESWVYRICQLEILTFLRRQRRRPALDPDSVDAASADPGSTPDVFAIERALRLLQELPWESERVIRLKHFEMLTFEEIGAKLAISSNTAKTTYYRALLKLRERFQGGELATAGAS